MCITPAQLYNTVEQVKGYVDDKTTTSEVNYSYDEQQIGTWVDGKPLYQKTIKVEIPTYSGTEDWKAYYFPINVENIDWINLYSGTLKNETTHTVFLLSINSLSGESYSVYTDIERKSNVVIYVGKSLYTTTYEGYVTIQYTKTTDTLS